MVRQLKTIVDVSSDTTDAVTHDEAPHEPETLEQAFARMSAANAALEPHVTEQDAANLASTDAVDAEQSVELVGAIDEAPAVPSDSLHAVEARVDDAVDDSERYDRSAANAIANDEQAVSEPENVEAITATASEEGPVEQREPREDERDQHESLGDGAESGEHVVGESAAEPSEAGVGETPFATHSHDAASEDRGAYVEAGAGDVEPVAQPGDAGDELPQAAATEFDLLDELLPPFMRHDGEETRAENIASGEALAHLLAGHGANDDAAGSAPETGSRRRTSPPHMLPTRLPTRPRTTASTTAGATARTRHARGRRLRKRARR